ncbi:MAG TPA: DUF4189 domain-containing protein [Burkholderiales bacterium]|nr:DUF4189 domain-containing protein [Burkholderiales bacterium]
MEGTVRVILFLALFVPAAVLAKDYFGAIAYSTRSGANGWAKDHASREAAERAAVAACSKHAKDCKAVLWFKNGCGALAVGAKAYGWGWGTTQALADTEAIKACAKHAAGCKVKHQVCTAGAN